MGRNMFGGGPGPPGQPIRGWGFGATTRPITTQSSCLTHHARDSVEMEGGTTFHFVTDGIESALMQARGAAGSRDVSLGGGASTVQQYLALGLVDELLISLVPVFLGDGTRLFDNLGAITSRPEQIEVVEAPGVTCLRYRFPS
jgi:dihydrofolate reductase